MEKDLELLDKDGGKVITPGYLLEVIHQKIDRGSDVIINSMSSSDLIVGRPIKINGKVLTVKTATEAININIDDILDIN